MKEAFHAVLLAGQRIGTLVQRGEVVRFVFADDYWSMPVRPVLGLWFEDNPRLSPQAATRLPSWFANLLPEGRLREWIARDQGVRSDKELGILLRIGRDLPGAVEVVGNVDGQVGSDWLDHVDRAAVDEAGVTESPWKFSLAGVGMKFSMLRRGDRLTVPGHDNLGNWIVKFPVDTFEDVPLNEFGTMSLAAEVGIDVPEIRLVDRADLPELPEVVWPRSERLAFAIERFDRGTGGERIHIEDFAQVRGWYPARKYDGTFETVAALAYRGQDSESLREFVRRLTFSFLVGNGDAHLKNWSLIYPDGRVPRLSPAYDLVSTAPYYLGSRPETSGLKFGGTKVFQRLQRSSFLRLQRRIGVGDADVIDVVDETMDRFFQVWGSGGGAQLLPKFARSWIADHSLSVSDRLRR